MLEQARKGFKFLSPGDVLDGNALPRWQSAQAGALALEKEAFVSANTGGARPSEAIRYLMAYHEAP